MAKSEIDLGNGKRVIRSVKWDNEEDCAYCKINNKKVFLKNIGFAFCSSSLYALRNEKEKVKLEI